MNHEIDSITNALYNRIGDQTRYLFFLNSIGQTDIDRDTIKLVSDEISMIWKTYCCAVDCGTEDAFKRVLDACDCMKGISAPVPVIYDQLGGGRL